MSFEGLGFDFSRLNWGVLFQYTLQEFPLIIPKPSTMRVSSSFRIQVAAGVSGFRVGFRVWG